MFSFMKRMKRILAIARIETLQLMRERTTFSLIVIIPAFQIILFGYAVNMNPKDVSLAVAGTQVGLYDHLEEIAGNTGYFAPLDGLGEQGEAEAKVRSGEALIGIELAEEVDFDDLEAEAKPLTVYVDASDAQAVVAAASMLENSYLRHLIGDVGGNGTSNTVWLYNPERQTAWTIVPGLVGAVVMISMLMLGALSIVSERERGTWETLLTTPVEGLDALVGKLSPCVIMAVVQAGLVLVAASGLFGVPMTGAFALLFIVVPLFAIAHLMLGFAFSTLAQTQLQAVQGAVAFYLPSMLLSGFMFPYQGMPVWAKMIAEFLPLTHFVRISRGLLLKGQSFTSLAVELLPVLIFLVVAMFFALKAYRSKLD